MRINSYIDHTLLKPDATETQIARLCHEALEHRFFSVCVNGCHVKKCAGLLRGAGVKVCAVVGFPLGAMATEAKRYETELCLKDGAAEIDMVMNIGALKSGADGVVEQDIRALAGECHKHSALLKVIIETALLSEEEKIKACHLSSRAGADFVKTCTGFSGGRATVEDVKLMLSSVKQGMRVKASAGIRDYQTALALIEAGAARIGASASVEIVGGQPA